MYIMIIVLSPIIMTQPLLLHYRKILVTVIINHLGIAENFKMRKIFFIMPAYIK